jgi:histidine phosphotransferase ChpT
MLAFCRVAFGASAGAQAFPSGELEQLTRAIFAHMRADLDWADMPETLPKAAARIVLNLAQMAGAALPAGGLVRIRAQSDGKVLALAVDASGARARLRQEVADGLALKPVGEGLSGPWAQATYAALVASEAGGKVVVEAAAERITFGAALPI